MNSPLPFVRMMPDLFGARCFIREWGRIGRPGQLRHVPYPIEDEAREALAHQRRAKERRGYRGAHQSKNCQEARATDSGMGSGASQARMFSNLRSD
jgi:predicted DNA-binding WGR domain protein